MAVALMVVIFYCVAFVHRNECNGDNLEYCVCQDTMVICPWMDMTFPGGGMTSLSTEYLLLEQEPAHKGIFIPFDSQAWPSLQVLVTPSGEHYCEINKLICFPKDYAVPSKDDLTTQFDEVHTEHRANGGFTQFNEVGLQDEPTANVDPNPTFWTKTTKRTGLDYSLRITSINEVSRKYGKQETTNAPVTTHTPRDSWELSTTSENVPYSESSDSLDPSTQDMTLLPTQDSPTTHVNINQNNDNSNEDVNADLKINNDNQSINSIINNNTDYFGYNTSNPWKLNFIISTCSFILIIMIFLGIFALVVRHLLKRRFRYNYPRIAPNIPLDQLPGSIGMEEFPENIEMEEAEYWECTTNTF